MGGGGIDGSGRIERYLLGVGVHCLADVVVFEFDQVPDRRPGGQMVDYLTGDSRLVVLRSEPIKPVAPPPLERCSDDVVVYLSYRLCIRLT
ncbi:hypothetical protein [Halalkalicoccus subterraneus]|uniref:hypothetical protein n=1 Tax=Halalkalicoccus subterraneus TaxID=2675002 RepID=UPI000EFDAB51|nr:hypothetical protein [Halalkalicoccus subterraneus]